MSNETIEPFDAFPNAPGLSHDLGLTRRTDGKVPPQYNEKGWRWYSICSLHRESSPDCNLCSVGSYVNNKRTNRLIPPS
jgi:hypothetical protein